MSETGFLWSEPERVALPRRTGAAGNPIAEIELSVHVFGEGPAIVLSHGFPETAYSWRYQVQPLVDAGFRVVVPNQRGYERSDSPKEIEAFDLEHLASDLAGLLDALDIDRAVFAGHDWGGLVVWSMPLLHPDRTAGVVGVNTPNVAFPGTDALRAVFPDTESMYMLWFQEPGVAEGYLDDRVPLVIDTMYRAIDRPTMESILAESTAAGGPPSMNPFMTLEDSKLRGRPLLSKEERAVYIEAFEHSGFRGGVSWYRNLDRNLELFPGLGQTPLDLPCLMITAECDLALRPELADGMKDYCSDLEQHMISDCGHWTQQEKPGELSSLMVDWLVRRFRQP